MGGLPSLPSKRFIFMFEGGPNDGQISSSDEPENPNSLTDARNLWFITSGGKLGGGYQGMVNDAHYAQFRAATAAADISMRPPCHVYHIVERNETDDEILILMRHAPEKTTSNQRPTPPKTTE
jgi:hypothetical protein